MKMSELEKKQELILEIEVSDKQYMLRVSVYANTPRALYLSAVTSGGKYLPLGKKGAFKNAVYNLYIMSDDKRLEWRSVDLETVPYGDKICYEVTTKSFNNEAQDTCRRVDPRLNVKKEAICYLGQNKIPVQIENLSLNGLAFSHPEEIGLVNNRIIIEIKDTVTGDDYEITLFCRCIRKAEMKDKSGKVYRYLYGCKISRQNYKYVGYLDALRIAELIQAKGIQIDDSENEWKDSRIDKNGYYNVYLRYKR